MESVLSDLKIKILFRIFFFFFNENSEKLRNFHDIRRGFLFD